jgi:tetrapyrrole methylase family protein/MazG family protein
MVASYLISAGYSPQEAILKIRSLSPSAINEEEERFLRELPVVLQADCLSEGSLFEEVLRVMRTLRGRCPWDKEQTHESLTKYLIEESWELNEAVAHKDPEKIKAELGDVLLQVVFHSVIGEEEGAFTTAEVLSGIRDKLIRRHPHVFGEPRALTPEGVEKQWESIKDEERRSDSEQSRRFMPALLRAERIQEIASHNGFDWKTDLGVLEKIKEETQELERSLLEASREKIVEEIGDLLFTLVNIARFLKINPEDALHRATDKFLKRYQKATDRIRKKGLNPSDLTLEELDAFWNESKSNRNSRKKYKS